MHTKGWTESRVCLDLHATCIFFRYLYISSHVYSGHIKGPWWNWENVLHWTNKNKVLLIYVRTFSIYQRLTLGDKLVTKYLKFNFTFSCITATHIWPNLVILFKTFLNLIRSSRFQLVTLRICLILVTHVGMCMLRLSKIISSYNIYLRLLI